MRAIAWDTWAFAETVLGLPRAAEVEALLDQADLVVTSREVVAETFTLVSRKLGSTRRALIWWDALQESHIRIIEPSLGDLRADLPPLGRLGTLSFADLSLAHAARAAGTKEVATADREFEAVGLTPLFAR